MVDMDSSRAMTSRSTSARCPTAIRVPSAVWHTLWVDDADDLAAAWRVAGADVREPQDTDWGQHEGVLIDPDGNIIRFGSPAGESGAGERRHG